MNRQGRAVGASVLAGALVGGCGFTSKAETDRLRDEVFALQTQLAEQVAAAEARQAKVDSLEQSLKERLETLDKAARRTDADLGVDLDRVREDVGRVKGDLVSALDRLSEVEAKTAKTQEEVDLRFQALAEKAKATEADSEGARSRAAEAVEAQKKLLSDPKGALERAEALIKEGKPAEARKLVRALEIEQGSSKGWPVYAPKAQYLVGESYFAEEDFRQAAAAYNEVRKKYPKATTWVPGSILKLGQCFERLGMKDDAKLFYDKVAKEFPKHPAGQEGKRLLAKLSS